MMYVAVYVVLCTLWCCMYVALRVHLYMLCCVFCMLSDALCMLCNDVCGMVYDI